MIVVATPLTPDMFFPSTACLIQDRIGASKAWGFDISAACSGFAYALTVGANSLAGFSKKVLVVGSDVMTSILNYEDRATCVLFGDGAGACFSSPPRTATKEFSISSTTSTARAVAISTCPPEAPSTRPLHETVDKKMHFVHQEGQQVFKYAVRRMSELAVEISSATD